MKMIKLFNALEVVVLVLLLVLLSMAVKVYAQEVVDTKEALLLLSDKGMKALGAHFNYLEVPKNTITLSEQNRANLNKYRADFETLYPGYTLQFGSFIVDFDSTSEVIDLAPFLVKQKSVTSFDTTTATEQVR